MEMQQEKESLAEQAGQEQALEKSGLLERGLLLKPVSLFALLLVLACAVALAYVGGVMSGRKSVEGELLRSLPKAESQALPVQNTPKETALLRPEELEFSRLLRNENRLPSTQSDKQGAKKEKPAQGKKDALGVSAASPAPAAKPETIPAKPQETALPETQPAPTFARGPLAAEKPLASPTLYDFVVQVAAVRSEDGADALRQRLEGHGLRTFLKREGKLFLVQVRFRGDTARSQELMAILQSLHLGKPLLISQKEALR